MQMEGLYGACIHLSSGGVQRTTPPSVHGPNRVIIGYGESDFPNRQSCTSSRCPSEDASNTPPSTSQESDSVQILPNRPADVSLWFAEPWHRSTFGTNPGRVDAASDSPAPPRPTGSRLTAASLCRRSSFSQPIGLQHPGVRHTHSRFGRSREQPKDPELAVRRNACLKRRLVKFSSSPRYSHHRTHSARE